MPSTSFHLSSVFARLGRLLLRLGFWLIAAVALVSLLVVSLGLLALGLLRALITGRRPQPMMKFNFQNFSASQGARFWPREGAGAAAEMPDVPERPEAPSPLASQRERGPRRRIGAGSGAVVDVEVREIPEQPRA